MLLDAFKTGRDCSDLDWAPTGPSTGKRNGMSSVHGKPSASLELGFVPPFEYSLVFTMIIMANY